MFYDNRLEKSDELKLDNLALKKISQILGIDEKELKSMELKKGFNGSISEILSVSENKKNKQFALYLINEVNPKYFQEFKDFHGNLEVIIPAIGKSSDNFLYINDGLKSNLKIGQEVLKSFIREGKNYFEVEAFIETNFGKETESKSKLYSFYSEYLDKVASIYNDDLSKNIIQLSQHNKELFNILKTKKVLKGTGSKIGVDPNFIKELLKELSSNNDYLLLDEANKEIFKQKIFEDKLGIKIADLGNDSLSVINNILDLLKISENKQVLKADKDNKDKDELNNDNISDKKVEKIEENDDNYDDTLDFCLPECSMTRISTGYQIDVTGNLKINISEEEKNNFTSLALKNFVIFYKTLHACGLNFLWDKSKYKSGFINICSNKKGFDYMSGEGITESKRLSVLNLIGKNVGIPEYSYEVNGEEKTEIKCFKTVGDAKNMFESIKGTGKINGVVYSDLGANSKGAVENKLISDGFLDINGGFGRINEW